MCEALPKAGVSVGEARRMDIKSIAVTGSAIDFSCARVDSRLGVKSSKYLVSRIILAGEDAFNEFRDLIGSITVDVEDALVMVGVGGILIIVDHDSNLKAYDLLDA